eukprot:6775828-Pyramimonas_sp.AAC.1
MVRLGERIASRVIYLRCGGPPVSAWFAARSVQKRQTLCTTLQDNRRCELELVKQILRFADSAKQCSTNKDG